MISSALSFAGAGYENPLNQDSLSLHLCLGTWYSDSVGFKAMDPDVARALISEHQDIITPATQIEDKVYKAAKCPVCGRQGAVKTIAPPKIVTGEDGEMAILRAPFNEGTPLVQGHAKCLTCETEFSPETGVIFKQDTPVLTDPHLTDE